MSGHNSNPGLAPAPVPRSQEQAAATQWMPKEDIEWEEAQRVDIARQDELIDALMPRRSAEAHREVPALNEDSINPRMDRQLPGPGVVRQPLSHSMKKDYNKRKESLFKGMSKTRFKRVERLLSDRERFNQANDALTTALGQQSELPENTRRFVQAMDRACSAYEAENPRTHILYTTLEAPYDHGSSRAAVLRRLQEMVGEEGGHLSFDGFIPATHSLAEVPDSREIVLEIRTRSGMYVGKSDSLPDANHMIGRGRKLRPVGDGFQEVEFIRPDGTRDKRTVFQVEDIT